MSSALAPTVRDADVLLALAQKVDPGHTAVLVIDVQNDFCAPGGYYERTGARIAGIHDMIPRLQRFLDDARAASVPVIFVAANYDEPYLTGVHRERHLRRFGRVIPCCWSGTWGAEFYGVAPAAGEPVIVKRRYSAFHGTDLDMLLRSRAIRTLVLAGVATNVCVETAARDAYMRDYYVVVVGDCTAARDENVHRAALANVEANFGVVATADALARAWPVRSASEEARA
jgi:ureidoacrylate peracid hydrolase